jgi:VanZ family protein
VIRPFLLWAPVVAYMALIFFASSLSNPPTPTNVSDKSLHFAAYFGLGVLAVRAALGGVPARVTRRGATLALLIAIGYGVFDEAHQWFVPGRTADVLDLLADSAGAVAALVVCWAWGILWLRSNV